MSSEIRKSHIGTVGTFVPGRGNVCPRPWEVCPRPWERLKGPAFCLRTAAHRGHLFSAASGAGFGAGFDVITF